MSDEPIGIGIVGCGGAATDLARAIDLLRDAYLAAAFDLAEPQARAIADPRGALVAGSYEQLLASPEVQVVYIGLPHNQLAPAAEAALRAGKHVLVEKPGALTVADLDDLDHLARSRGLRLGTAFVVRQAGAVRLARELVTAGAIGEISQVRVDTVLDKPASYWVSGAAGRVAAHWRSSRQTAGGGVVLMNSLHQLDAVRFITRLEYARVSAELGTTTAGVEVEDSAAAVFRLSNGAILSLSAAAHSPGAEREERIEFDGSLGRIDVPDVPGRDRIRLFLRRQWGGYPAGARIELMAQKRELYPETLAAFLGAVRDGTDAPVGAADAGKALAAVLAAYSSAVSGAAVSLRLPDDGEAAGEHLLNSRSLASVPIDRRRSRS